MDRYEQRAKARKKQIPPAFYVQVEECLNARWARARRDSGRTDLPGSEKDCCGNEAGGAT